MYPGGIASNGTYVVWTTLDGPPASDMNGTGSIMAVPVSGGTPTALVTHTDNAAVVCIDSTYAYWFGPSDNDIEKVPLTGGAVTSILKNLTNSIFEMTIDPTYIYWSNVLDQVRRVPIGGGTNSLLIDLSAAGYMTAYQTEDLAVSSAGIFVFSDTGIVGAPLAGGSSSTLASDQTPVSLVADGTSVYWGNPAAGIMKVGVGGGTPVMLATLVLPEVPAYMRVDNDALYWIEPSGSVKKVPIGGGSSVVLAPAPQAPGGLALDATNVYWSDINGGVVYKLPK
jgi:hypothetical protein